MTVVVAALAVEAAEALIALAVEVLVADVEVADVEAADVEAADVLIALAVEVAEAFMSAVFPEWSESLCESPDP